MPRHGRIIVDIAAIWPEEMSLPVLEIETETQDNISTHLEEKMTIILEGIYGGTYKYLGEMIENMLNWDEKCRDSLESLLDWLLVTPREPVSIRGNQDG